MAELSTQEQLDAMLAHRERMIIEHPEAKTAAQLAEFMGEHASTYWRWKLGEYFENELGGGTAPLFELGDVVARLAGNDDQEDYRFVVTGTTTTSGTTWLHGKRGEDGDGYRVTVAADRARLVRRADSPEVTHG